MPLIGYLFVTALLTSLPVILVVLVVRDRIGRRAGSALVALAFAATSGYRMWRLDWFDVWRHESTPATYFINYVPVMLVMAAAGWLIASALLRRARGALLRLR